MHQAGSRSLYRQLRQRYYKRKYRPRKRWPLYVCEDLSGRSDKEVRLRDHGADLPRSAPVDLYEELPGRIVGALHVRHYPAVMPDVREVLFRSQENDHLHVRDDGARLPDLQRRDLYR